MLPQLGKILILIGIITVILGGILLFADKIPLLGKLPGDIVIRKKNFSLYFPLATSIVLSVVLSLVLSFFGQIFRK